MKPKRTYKRKKRSQKVRFRRRYATNVLQRSLVGVYHFLKVSFFTFLIAGTTIYLWTFWNTSPTLKLQTIQFDGDIPSGLKHFLSIKEGDNIVMLRVRTMEKAALSEYPELAKLSITRKFDRSVVVSGTYREPLTRWNHPRQAIDQHGIVFSLTSDMPNTALLPMANSAGSDRLRKNLAECLWILKEEMPKFYQRLDGIKTDTMNATIFTDRDGVVIHWGEADPTMVVEKAKKVENVFERFRPSSKKASMRFVEKDRIVLNRGWKQVS